MPKKKDDSIRRAVAEFQAGIDREVLVSLWKVHDQTTAQLMEQFYRRLLIDGRSPPAALRAAQDSIRRQERRRQPYYWAGFILQGEWQDIERR